MTIEGSSSKEIISQTPMIDCSIKVGDAIKTENLTWKQCHDMAEEIKQSNAQNKEIIDKYKITLNVYGFDTEQTFDVIKKLEIDIFQLQSSLKLSQELNAKYEKIIKDLKNAFEFQRAYYEDRIKNNI